MTTPRAAIGQVVHQFGLQVGASPSSTVSVLRWDDETVEAYVLADSPIVILLRDGTHMVLTDDRIYRVAAGIRADRDQILKQGKGFGAELGSVQKEARGVLGSARNTAGGFWVAEADADAAVQGYRARWSREDVAEAIVCSDGFSAAVDIYGVYPSWAALFEDARRCGLGHVAEQISAAEAADPRGQRWHRNKYDDDVTAVYVQF